MLNKQYLSFISGNRRFLSFGFLSAFISSFGQTYFIGVFGPNIQVEFALSHTQWGIIYMLGTLASAALLPWSGKFIDQMDLRRFALLVCGFSVFACAFIALSNGSIMLIMAIFLLRHSGQGLMSHMSLTSMARYFDAQRGRAIAIGSLGYAAGEASLPFIAVLLIMLLGWRWTYALAGGAMLLVLFPLCYSLLRGQEQRHHQFVQSQHYVLDTHGSQVKSWTRKQMLGDRRFYLLIPGVICPSMVSTALFFHHLNLADAKHWSHTWITGSYSLYAVAVVVISILAGSLIDRLGAAPLVRIMLLPLALAVYLIGQFQAPWIVWPYMLLLGLGTGLVHTGVSAIWAELYGTSWLGSIRSLAAGVSVFSSALGPVLVGVIVDQGVAIEVAFLYFIPYMVFCTVLIHLALSRHRQQHPT